MTRSFVLSFHFLENFLEGKGHYGGVSYTYEFTMLNKTDWKLEWNLNRPLRATKSQIQSPSLHVVSTNWLLILYPNGDRPEHSNFISIYLHNDSKHHREVQVAFYLKTYEDIFMMGSDNGYYRIEPERGLGYGKFIPHSLLLPPGPMFYENEVLRMVVVVQVKDPSSHVVTESLSRLAIREQTTQNERSDSALCVVCMERSQTSGFLHQGEAHRCVCKQCAKLLFDRSGSNLKCPVCSTKVDSVVYKFY